MAKGCYVGPISNIPIDETNISDHFEVTNSTYGFEWTTVNGSKCLAPTNYGVNSSTATMTLKLKHNVDRLAVGYSYITEDRVTFKIGSTYVINGASGSYNNSYYSDALTAGTIITFSYSRNNLDYEGDESVLFKNLAIQSDRVAHKVKNIYVGVETEVPIYETVETTVTIDVDNINDFFDVTNSTYYFEGSDTVFAANNLGVNSTTATTVLKLKQDVTNLSFQYRYVTEANYDKITFKVGSTTVLNADSGTYGPMTFNAGDLTAGTTLTFSYTKDSSQSASGEFVLFRDLKFTAETTTQTGTETKSVARKIKKGYVGVGGVAKLCYALQQTLVPYNGTVTGLSLSAQQLAATTVGNYGIFAGGYGGSYRNSVDIYDETLTHTQPSNLLTRAKTQLAATTVGNYALFGGGKTANTTYSYNVEGYNTSLTHYSPESFYTARALLAATTVGNYALFGGGYSGDGNASAVDSYNGSLTRNAANPLVYARNSLAATTVGNHALFGGGIYTASTPVQRNTVDVYNSDLTSTNAASLSAARSCLAATTVGNYALFGGGITASGKSDVVNAYSSSLTKTTVTPLTMVRGYLAATTLGDYAIFAGGYDDSDVSNRVDIYDSSLTRLNYNYLTVARSNLAATTVGNYALFGGGNVSGYTKVVDAFTLK